MDFYFMRENMFFQYSRRVACCVALSALTACASGARTGAMTAPLAPSQIVSDTSPIKNAIAVGAVAGGDETNPLWVSQVSNANFKKALEDSLALAVLKGNTGAPYLLTAKLVSVHQPFAGFDMTVTSTVEYTLTATGQTAPVLNETVVTPYTANFGDALYGPERMRLANEGAMRENIQEIIARMIKASAPGGPLSTNLPVRTSELH